MSNGHTDLLAKEVVVEIQAEGRGERGVEGGGVSHRCLTATQICWPKRWWWRYKRKGGGGEGC